LRRRWRALTVLGVLAGVTAGLAMAAIAGARRTDTAWERLRAETHASDAIVFTSQAGIFFDEELDYDDFADLPYVTEIGAFGLAYGTSKEHGEFGGFLSSYGTWLDELDTPHIIEGRLPSPDAAEEVVLSKPREGGEAYEAGVGLGSEITFSIYTQEQQFAGRFDEAEGPTVTLRIVGISDSPWGIAAIPSDGDIYIGPAFREKYGEGLAAFSNLVVRLEDPERDIRRLEAAVGDKYPGRDVPVSDLATAGKRVTNGTDLERSGLLLFGAAVALAGVVIVGQALTRSVRAAGGELPVLIALGFSRNEAVRALALPHMLATFVAVVTATALAVALSPRFPIGLGRRVEPDVGLHVDLPVIAGGAVLLAMLLTGAVIATAWRATRESGLVEQPRRSVLVAALRSAGAPVAMSTGAGFALDPGRGSRALPTRPAIMGSVAGVLGIVGAFTLAAGIDDAVDHPERFGTVWDMSVNYAGEGPLEPYLEMPEVLEADPDTADVARTARIPVAVGGVSIPLYALDPVKGTMEFVVLEGRPPSGGSEVVLGPDSAKALGVDIGDEVTVGEAELTVVGLGLLPTTAHSSFDQGAWTAPEGIQRALSDERTQAIRDELSSSGLPPEVPDEDLPYLYGGVSVTFADGVDVDAAIERVTESSESLFVEGAFGPADQANLRNVRPLPLLFGAFAILLAIGALAHVSASVLRRRRGDLAVLRSMGCTPRQARASLAWQATTLAAIGLVLGVPLGFAAGRVAWRSVADAIPMVYVAPMALLALVLVVPAALLVANLLAAWPGRRAARLRPADVLRSE
jgi:ABC-type lipoprotein release transport system permease subunit